MGAGNQLGHAALCQLLPLHAAADVLRQLEEGHPHAQGPAEGVVHPHRQHPPALLADQAHQVVGAGEAAGEHHGDDAVIPVHDDLAQGLFDVLAGGQGGLRQLAGAETGVDVPPEDVHTVGILPVGAQNPQRHPVDVILLCQTGGQVGAGVRQQGNLLWNHKSSPVSSKKWYYNDYRTNNWKLQEEKQPPFHKAHPRRF